MDSSPDWNRDADARGWQDSRQALVGRTAAVHKPWARTPRPADPSSPVPLDPTGLLRTTEYRARKKELEHGREQPGRALAGDLSSTLAFRTGLAWSQHAFSGGNY